MARPALQQVTAVHSGGGKDNPSSLIKVIDNFGSGSTGSKQSSGLQKQGSASTDPSNEIPEEITLSNTAAMRNNGQDAMLPQASDTKISEEMYEPEPITINQPQKPNLQLSNPDRPRKFSYDKQQTTVVEKKKSDSARNLLKYGVPVKMEQISLPFQSNPQPNPKPE